jgi:antibiotic biosynthesis monooxygenase (ABM) superfamily enzyme
MVKKTVSKKTSAKKTSKRGINSWFMPSREPSTLNDIKNAILLVSLTINLLALIVWLVLRLTTDYDAQLSNLLLSR